MPNQANLTGNPVTKTLIQLTIPMIAGMIGMVIFNLIDTYFVGLLGTDQLAAMSFTFPVVMIQGSISMGLGVGTSAVVSRLIGQGDIHRIRRQATDSLILSVGIVVIMMCVGLLTVKPVFYLLGARGRILDLTFEYMRIWYLGVPFVVIPMVGNNIIRATGNTVIPALIMLIAGLMNAILDPVLIFGYGPFPALGLKGAALATVISRGGTLVASLLVLNFKFKFLTRERPVREELFFSWKEMLFVGIPAAITQLILPLSMTVITRMVAGFGKEAVAAIGVGTRIEAFALSPVMALSAVLLPFVGQNLGAGKPERIKEGVKFSRLFSLLFGAGILIIFLFGGKGIGSLFSKDELVIRVLYKYLVIISAGYGLMGVMTINASLFNAFKKPFHSMALSVLRAFLLYIPLSYILSLIWDVEGVFFGGMIASLIAGVISWVWGGITVEKAVS